jgi:hypothetical protein
MDFGPSNGHGRAQSGHSGEGCPDAAPVRHTVEPCIIPAFVISPLLREGRGDGLDVTRQFTCRAITLPLYPTLHPDLIYEIARVLGDL